MDKLNDKTFLLYAIKQYNNPQCCDLDEFNEDINRIKYIKRLLRRYDKTGELRERLILNHIIILGNLFSPKVASRLLMFKIEEELHSYLKTFLLFLDFIPEDGIPEYDLEIIPLDNKIITSLRTL
jgi:hypothetical protein|tara:strand:- start:195 stop:569 length:375 start_codon:yes stop_codon:yes gene_type:complete